MPAQASKLAVQHYELIFDGATDGLSVWSRLVPLDYQELRVLSVGIQDAKLAAGVCAFGLGEYVHRHPRGRG